MNIPRFTAEASLYRTSERHGLSGAMAGRLSSILAQSLFCSRAGQPCGGIDLVCCPGLKCTAGLGGLGVCMPDFFRCSLCIDGWQFCCPPRGFGVSCHLQRCIA